jgi:hypothetical protein
MKLCLVFALVACGSKSSSEGSSATTESKPNVAAIGLPRVTHASRDRFFDAYMVMVGDKLVAVDPADIFGDAKHRNQLGDGGKLSPSSGTWRPPPPPTDNPRPNPVTLVVVDREVPAARLRSALAPLHGACVAFLGASADGPVALIPDPCPAARLADLGEMVELAVWVDKDRTQLGITRLEDVRIAEDRAKLEHALKELKAGSFFADRKDVVIAFHAGATAGDVIETLDLASDAGFTDAVWAESKDLPLDLEHGVQRPRPAPAKSPHGPTLSVGQPVVQGDLDKAIIRRYIKLAARKITYCYEKELLAKPALDGTVSVEFVIDGQGKVTKSTASGVDPNVASCVADAIKAIEFPAPKGGGAVIVNYPLLFHTGS